ncbi:hypothetical protein NDU88_010138 [Pleurodeles waltl]|uniref:Uncharacterized protein n=1 Tax=Pleurodeles waltl TaxID=8319 RepID=A0AAV7PUU7_PLEWA|nr:hypothetical protein NDU88_010138 [Pleurodeles waltl]
MRDPNLEEAIQIAKRMEHAAVWLQEMDVKSTQAEQGIVAEIKRKEEPRGAVRWNKFDKDDDGVRENKVEKRKTQDWRGGQQINDQISAMLCFMGNSSAHERGGRWIWDVLNPNGNNVADWFILVWCLEACSLLGIADSAPSDGPEESTAHRKRRLAWWRRVEGSPASSKLDPVTMAKERQSMLQILAVDTE